MISNLSSMKHSILAGSSKPKGFCFFLHSFSFNKQQQSQLKIRKNEVVDEILRASEAILASSSTTLVVAHEMLNVYLPQQYFAF